MSNQPLIKSAHMWFLAVLVAFGLLAVGGRAAIRADGQNSNQNSNTGNMNRSQNRNANRSNRNSSNANATGEQTGMATLTSHDRSEEQTSELQSRGLISN